jgi:hypothetical protein
LSVIIQWVLLFSWLIKPANHLQAATGPVVEKIYWVETEKVQSINKDATGAVDLLVPGLSIGFDIALDEVGGKVYWADRATYKISRSDLDGSNVEDLYSLTASDRPFTITLDVAAGDLYYASPDSKTIKRAKMDGSTAPVVIYDQNDASAAPNQSKNPGIRDVRGMALDVAAGIIYWTDRGSGDDRVVRGSMDGTMVPQLLYTQGSGSTQGVALDVDAGMLYWANSGRGQIERAKMDGSGSRESLYVGGTGSGGGPTGIALDVAAGDLYWTSTTADDVRRGKMDGPNVPGGTPVILASGLNNPFDIALGSSVGGSQPLDEAPVITLLGDNPLIVECGDVYIDPGANAIDDIDGDLSVSVAVDSSAVNMSVSGSYTVTYDATDSGGNTADQVTRTVTVQDTTAPVITLNGLGAITLECSLDTYSELGATAVDACDSNVTVVISGDSVNANALGSYVVTYDAVDASGNIAAQLTRTVTVQDTTAPVITLNGASLITLECHVDAYTEDGAIGTDDCDSNVIVTIGGDTVDVNSPGSYVVIYNAVDATGNAAVEVTRTITVQDLTSPVITLLGINLVTIECPGTYEELGAIAEDLCGGDLTSEITIDASEVNTQVTGSYQVVYTLADAAGNTTIKTRDVEVVDTVAPVIAVIGELDVVLLQNDPYQEEGASVSDACDQNVTVEIGGDVVDTLVIGVYAVTFDAEDASGNAASTQVRTVTVLPRFATLDALFGCVEVKLEKDSIVNGSLASMYGVDLQEASRVFGDVIIVAGQAQLQKNALVDGNVDAGGKVTIHKNADVGSSVISGGKIDLKSKAHIGGDATSASTVKLGKGASVDGAISENQAIAPLREIPLPVLAFATSGSDIKVKKNTSETLIPGAYMRLDAKNNTLIELVSGHYTFSEIKVGSASEILLNLSAGPITVDVVGDVQLDGVEMVLWNGEAQDVLFQVQGEEVKLGSQSEKSNAQLLGSYVGNFLVPNGKLMLESGATLTGSVYARSVHMKKDSVLNAEAALDLLVGASVNWLGMESCLLEDKKSASKSADKSESKSGDSESEDKSESKSEDKKEAKLKNKKR